jgi:aspartyl-tRNA synthetase
MSNTPRHLTEFTGLDMEMCFNSHYHEVLDVVDGMLKHVFASLKQNYSKEIKLVRDHEKSGKEKEEEERTGKDEGEFLFLDETLRLEFKEAVKLLREGGHEMGELEDFKCVSLLDGERQTG